RRLEGVLRGVTVGEDAAADAEDGRAVPGDQGGERRLVAGREESPEQGLVRHPVGRRGGQRPNAANGRFQRRGTHERLRTLLNLLVLGSRGIDTEFRRTRADAFSGGEGGGVNRAAR